ncbi:MAG: porin [Hymenobacteraceae bacterium]|nr:porin [Hymenobacteraceae bacterium]
MRTRTKLAAVLITLLWWGTAAGQDHHRPEQQVQTIAANDTPAIRSMKELFTKGEVGGHVRNFFMATVNHRSLSDNYANAIGAEIGFRTASFHGFRAGFAGLFTYNLFSSNIGKRDPVAEKHPKLELELFDIEDPDNKADLDRLDELYLEYGSARLRARAGRFSFTSPLINPQDGRMKPYSFQGISVQVPLREQNLLTLAWFDHFSPRSTVSWFRADEAIGIFSPGVDTDGNPSGYPHHLSTAGVAVAGLQLQPGRRLSTETWTYWIENISSTSYSRMVAAVTPRVKIGIEGLYQFRVGNGGNPEQSLAYFPDQRQWLLGTMLAYEPDSWHLSMNYLRIGAKGRLLFPREWGREQFFVTLPRGRLEGTGNTDMLVAKARKRWSERLYAEIALARSWLPAPEEYRRNKYGAVSYWGWVADLQYIPARPVLEGLSVRLLYVGRMSPGKDIPLREMYYNTNFHHLNLVTQLTF